MNESFTPRGETHDTALSNQTDNGYYFIFTPSTKEFYPFSCSFKRNFRIFDPEKGNNTTLQRNIQSRILNSQRYPTFAEKKNMPSNKNALIRYKYLEWGKMYFIYPQIGKLFGISPTISDFSEGNIISATYRRNS